MLNTEKLNELNQLGKVRMNIGASTPDEESYDSHINEMDADVLISVWLDSRLDNNYWWYEIKKMVK